MSDDESLGRLYRAAIADLPATGHLDPAEARRTARKRRQRQHGATAGLVVTALLGAAVFAAAPGFRDGSALPAVPQAPPTSAQPEPDMSVEPATAPAGSIIVVRFADRFVRGVAFQLESRQGSDWRIEYYLVAGINGGEPRQPWWHVDDPKQGGGWPDIGQSGPASLRVPDDAEPGKYRLCTANTNPTACTLLTIR
jgi:hypothetical protein